MTPPQSSILRDHPRKFALGGIVVAALSLIGGQPVGIAIGIGLALSGAACWLDDDRYQAVKRYEWDRFCRELDKV
jgi:hypothetical protein